MDHLRVASDAELLPATRSLHVVIVGAGITGLAVGLALSLTGHCVTILESISEIEEVGAGLQLAPNACRVLRRFGILDEVREQMTMLSNVSIRRYDSDEEIGSAPLMPTLGDTYGAPMGVIHRADLQRILLRAARMNGCKILTSHVVIAVDEHFHPRVQVRNKVTTEDQWFSGDAIIAADGIRSTVRREIAKSLGYPRHAIPTGDAAYRVLIPRTRIEHDKVLLSMLDENKAMRYMGPHGHIMAYPLKEKTLYNMVLIHPATSERQSPPRTSWTDVCSGDEMLAFYSNWSPAIRAWLSHADTPVYEWNLETYEDLPRWVHGGIALAGDACHPMLPYVAQGAANGLEDAGVLAVALSRSSNVASALAVYELVRKERAERIAASADVTRRYLHLLDGPEQRERDDAIRGFNPGAKGDGDGDGDKWRDEHWQNFMWGVDVMRDTMDNWPQLVARAATLMHARQSFEAVVKESRVCNATFETLAPSRQVAAARFLKGDGMSIDAGS
ncbi:Salicylate hydroxylase [Paramyrothecium foliicola]|nr:Salicylate hydroxylase [Paramyrothecium foliicola]